MKNGKQKICIVDFKKLNATTKNDPYPLPFINEVLNIVAGHDVYSFLHGYFGYHKIFIAPEHICKITFETNWGALDIYDVWNKEWTSYSPNGSE
jgi:hypothetical protein